MTTVMSGSGGYGTTKRVNFKISLQCTSIQLTHRVFE